MPVYEYKGLNKVNPTALLLSAAMMLEHLNEKDAARRMDQAIAEVIREGKHVTYDLKDDHHDPSAVGTREMGEAIAARVKALR